MATMTLPSADLLVAQIDSQVGIVSATTPPLVQSHSSEQDPVSDHTNTQVVPIQEKEDLVNTGENQIFKFGQTVGCQSFQPRLFPTTIVIAPKPTLTSQTNLAPKFNSAYFPEISSDPIPKPVIYKAPRLEPSFIHNPTFPKLKSDRGRITERDFTFLLRHPYLFLEESVSEGIRSECRTSRRIDPKQPNQNISKPSDTVILFGYPPAPEETVPKTQEIRDQYRDEVELTIEVLFNQGYKLSYTGPFDRDIPPLGYYRIQLYISQSTNQLVDFEIQILADLKKPIKPLPSHLKILPKNSPALKLSLLRGQLKFQTRRKIPDPIIVFPFPKSEIAKTESRPPHRRRRREAYFERLKVNGGLRHPQEWKLEDP
ncbi:hypothetical protein M231_06024 [Tremella mesenterica]|uniref:Uncharacterized protein n=1 Tax=Tremella mesenterica TaxID=5217 RepID=A0A4V1M3F8_TREME|nr:hypothetical protein M231_06024 [Tremella mesenterica]